MAELFNGAKPLLPVSERDGIHKAINKIKARRKIDYNQQTNPYKYLLEV